MPSVSDVTTWGGTGWFNYKALDEPYKAHFARTCIRPEVNRLLCSAQLLNNSVRVVSGTPVWDGSSP